MKGELYEYNGKQMTQAEIAREEDISRSTLADWYKKTNNMAEAVKGAKKSLAQRNIAYNEKNLSLKAISVKEHVKFETLKKNFEYCQDIYEAVRLAKEAKEKHNGTIPYNERLMTISGIAELEGIKRDTLAEFYNIYGDINKAVFITKKSQLKRKQALHKGNMITYQQISNYFGVSNIELDKMIESGKNLDEIEKRTKKGKLKKDYLTIGDNSLYRFCLDHSYNYWVMNYMINTYGKTPEEALEAYLSNGQQIPTKWIYEKYNILFKHLMLNFGLDSNRIIKIIKSENCDIEEAITRLIFLSNNERNDFRPIEIDWLHELYLFIKDLADEEISEAREAFYITDREMHFMEEKSRKIEVIKRQLLLFEFSMVIDNWDEKDTLEMIDLYGITPEEMTLVITQLYNPFSQGILNLTGAHLEKQKMITDLVTNSQIGDEDIINNEVLSQQDKGVILKKRQLINIFINNRIEINSKKM